MPTLRRILNYTPAVVLGLLVVAWVLSGVSDLHMATCLNRGGEFYLFAVGLGEGSLYFRFMHEPFAGFCRSSWELKESLSANGFVGSYQFWLIPIADGTYNYVSVELPFIGCLTATFPLAIGPFLSFRFRLWHYLAYTALVAVELAYYLRWQE